MKKLPLLLLSLALAFPVLAQKKIIQPPEFPAGGNFSPGILVNGTLYVAGQTGNDLKTGKIPEKFEDEVKSTLDRVGIILKAGGMDYKDVVSVNVYLTDLTLFGAMNQVYATYFKTERPVRATVQVAGLVGGAKIEISVTAQK